LIHTLTTVFLVRYIIRTYEDRKDGRIYDKRRLEQPKLWG